MKSIIKNGSFQVMTIFVLAGTVAFSADQSIDHEQFFSIPPVLTLTLKVSSQSSSGADDSLLISEWRSRNLQMEQSLWSIIQAETRVYTNKMTRPSFSLCQCYRRCYYAGTTFLLRRSRQETHRLFNPHARDSYDSHFDYTNFLSRSNRLKSHYGR